MASVGQNSGSPRPAGHSTTLTAARSPSKSDCIDQEHYGCASKKGQSEWRNKQDVPPCDLPGIVAIKTVHLHAGPTDEP